MTTQIQSQTLVELAVAQLSGSRKFLLGLVETLEDSQLTTRVGGVGNHAIWVLGHIAFADDLFVSEFRGEASSLPEGHVEQFGQGSVPSGKSTDYPSRDEMLKRLADAREHLIEWVKTLEGDAAWQEAPESIKPLTPDAISAAFTLTQHEFLHAGQLTTIRSSLGMKPLFG